MKLTDKDIAETREELRTQKEPSRPKKRLGKKLFPVKYSSDYINASEKSRRITWGRGRVPRGVGLSGDKPTSVEFRNPFLQSLPPGLLTPLQAKPSDTLEQVNGTYVRRWANSAGSKHGVDQFHPLRVSASWTLYLYANEYFWEHIREDGTIHRSIIYRNKAQAYHAKDYEYVTWFD